MKKHFILFLKEKEIYEKYRYYIISQGNDSLKDILFNNKESLISSSMYYENLIMSAFTWAYTQEGVNFWCDIHNKWVYEVRKLKNKGIC